MAASVSQFKLTRDVSRSLTSRQSERNEVAATTVQLGATAVAPLESAEKRPFPVRSN